MTDQQLQLLKRIDKKLTLLLREQKKPEPETWVNASVIYKMTGFSKEKLRTLRTNEVIRFERKGKRCIYLLESLPKVYLKTA